MIDLGHVPYREAWEVQERLRWQRQKGEISDTILLVEHSPVITIGRDPKGKKDFLESPEWFKKNGIEIIETNRGGKLTYHGPEQLVAYFIFDLKEANISIHSFVKRIEKIGAGLLHHFGLEVSFRDGNPGVWTPQGKILFIGLHVSRNVTLHGMALNVGGSLAVWEKFIPCGLQDCAVTSMEKELQKKISVDTVKREFRNQASLISENVGAAPREPLVSSCSCS